MGLDDSRLRAETAEKNHKNQLGTTQFCASFFCQLLSSKFFQYQIHEVFILQVVIVFHLHLDTVPDFELPSAISPVQCLGPPEARSSFGKAPSVAGALPVRLPHRPLPENT